MSHDTDDPGLKAIIAFVESSCAITVAEATGFHNSTVIEERRAEARKAFITEMNKLTQDEGP